MKTFNLRRLEDESGVSGTGIVAQGCVFDNGYVALTWLTHLSSLVWYHSVDVMLTVHGHGGKTVIEYEHPSDPPVVTPPVPNVKKRRKS